ncbi:MAG TPA: histidine kinase dimerization/phosphoacceptor domain -containing protein, partial [Methanothermobacter sp.]|nr:histidine kinase dimerization/phosphoacceptor domain -containing protein [Methanothermobacter sp.]HOQ20300.1 histidine kinase dimerization/phosphoacceptor domain -containing protein [Methanothermobacter sp.]
MGVGRIRGTKRSVVSLTDITDLKEAFEEIGILLREIHHRVKNNLQIISS